MKKKHAIRIIREVLESLRDDDRMRADQAELLSSMLNDIMYNGKIRINNYLEYDKECFEELEKQ